MMLALATYVQAPIGSKNWNAIDGRKEAKVKVTMREGRIAGVGGGKKRLPASRGRAPHPPRTAPGAATAAAPRPHRANLLAAPKPPPDTPARSR